MAFSQHASIMSRPEARDREWHVSTALFFNGSSQLPTVGNPLTDLLLGAVGHATLNDGQKFWILPGGVLRIREGSEGGVSEASSKLLF